VSSTHATMLVEKGCTLLSPVNDVRVVNAGMKALKKDFADWFAD